MVIRGVVGKHEITSSEHSADGVVARLPNFRLRVIRERQKRVEYDGQGSFLP